MQFFSRKKTLLTLSLAALGGLAACGDDVTVPVAPAASVVITMTPSNASMNINDTQIFSVQIAGGSTTTPPTLASCSTSNAAVATVVKAGTGSSCNVTAVAAGNATITAVASTGQQTSSAVSVSALAPAISGLTLSPTAANLAPQQQVTITPNVTRGATGNAVAYTYTTSNSAIATVGAPAANGAVVVTAVAPGVATITATATGTGTGFSQSVLTAASTITVGAFPSGITTLTVQPTSLNMAVGRTASITSSVSQPAGAPAVTYSIQNSNPAVASATVNATTGAVNVTAIAPGTTNITLTASSAANATFAASTLTQVVAVTVSPLANVSIQAINQGPYVTTGLDSAYTTLTGCVVAGTPTPAACQTPTGAIGNPPIGPPQGVIAGIRRALNPQIGQPIDVTNTKDQIQVLLNLQANGQRVDSVVVYIDPASTTARRAAARQIFTNGDAGNQQTVTIETFILTEDFTTNDVTGFGEAHFLNGLKAISASVWTTLPAGSAASACPVAITAGNTCELQNAANVRQNVNFNNIDGFALKMQNPANSQVDAAGRTWWGGPTVNDIGQPSGLGQFQVYPVLYTPGRTVTQVTATMGRCRGFDAAGLPNGVLDNAAPFVFTFGTTTPNQAPASSVFINCSGIVGAYDQADQYRFEDYPMVVSSLDNSNNPGPRTLYAYNPTTSTDPYAGPRPTLFRSSPQLVNPNPIRIDYQAPVLALAVTQANGERWVNDAYAFNSGGRYSATDFIDAVTPVTGVGVGLFPTATRNTIFRVASANPLCGPQTFQDVGGLGATIAQVFSIAPNTNRESPCDFTANAFVAQATETDRLGNRGTIGNLQSTAANGTVTAASPLFGIDNTAPEISRAADGAGPIPDMPNFYQAPGDSIFQPLNPNTGVPATPIALPPAANPTDFLFGVRYRDERSGFNITNHGTRTVQRWAPAASPVLSNRAVITTVSTRTLAFTGGNGNPVETEDPTFRRDSVTIYGAGPLGGATGNGAGAAAALTPTPAVGYYQYLFSVVDRAGNSSSLTERAVIDRDSPIVTGTQIPALFGVNSGTAVAQQFVPTGTDDVEAIDFDMFFRYNAMGMVGDSSAGSTVINYGSRVRFRRDRFANPHNAWAVFGDTLLNTPFGPGAALSSSQLVVPIPSIRGIEPVDSTDAPIAYGTGAVNPFTGFKPDKIGVYAFDVRATHVGTTFLPPYNTNPPFVNLGMTNLFPTASPAGGEAAYTENLFVGNIANGARWDTKDLNTATAGIDRLVSWSGFGGTGSTIEFRAVTSTVVTQPPFAMVHLFRWEGNAQHTGSGVGTAATTLNDSAAGQWVYIGTVNSSAPANPAINDQGSSRFWRFFFTSSAFPTVTNGSIVQPGVTTGCYRAVGVDLVGDGITTRSFGVGCPATVGPNANQITVVSAPPNATVTLRAYGNGTGTITATTGTAFTLTKSSVNQVERISQNRPNTGELFTITPTGGSTIDRAPSGCTPTTPVVFPTAAAFQCSFGTFTPQTVTVIFELPGAGGP